MPMDTFPGFLISVSLDFEIQFSRFFSFPSKLRSYSIGAWSEFLIFFLCVMIVTTQPMIGHWSIALDDHRGSELSLVISLNHSPSLVDRVE